MEIGGALLVGSVVVELSFVCSVLSLVLLDGQRCCPKGRLFLRGFLLLSVVCLGEPQVCGWAGCAGSGVCSSRCALLVVLFLRGIAFLAASYRSCFSHGVVGVECYRCS